MFGVLAVPLPRRRATIFSLVAILFALQSCVIFLLPPLLTQAKENGLAKVPPMGWMSWEIFRCETNCSSHPDGCINDKLYETMTDALVSGGFLEAGYDGIHIDDCWMKTKPSRDKVTKELVPDPERFPKGFKALGDYMHAKNVRFAIYTAESPSTCAGYPASAGFETIDANTFAKWGVDYLSKCVCVCVCVCV